MEFALNIVELFITSWRAGRRERIFRDGEDRRFFIRALGEVCERIARRRIDN